MRLTVLTVAAALCLAGGAFAQTSPDVGAAAPAAAAPARAGSPGDGAATGTPAPADATAAPAPAADTATTQEVLPPVDPTNPPSTGPQILVSTSMGDITIQLDSVRAPKSVANILRYVKAKHYEGTVIYRVVKDALIEMGSWDAKVQGRPSLPGKVPLEVRNGLSNVRASVALARGEEPDSAGADFFINIGDESPLDAAKDVPGNTTGYAVFGQVIKGMDVVDAISKVPVGDKGPMPGQAPITPITIKVTIVPGTDDSAASAPAAKPAAKKKKP